MKKIMLMLLSVTVIMLPAIEQSAQSQSPEDPYNISNVRSLILQAQARPRISIGSLENENNHLGDSAAIAVIKIYREGDLTNPLNVQAYLPVIRAAFQFPNLILRKDDQDPKATLLLLRYLESNLKDASLRKEVIDLEAQLSKLQPGSAPASH